MAHHCFTSRYLKPVNNDSLSKFHHRRFKHFKCCAVSMADTNEVLHFPLFLPPEVSQLREASARIMASRIQRLPVQTSLSDSPILTSCVPPKTKQHKAPPVLLLHGFDSSCLEWRRTYPLLEEKGIEAWAVDILGWGFSTSEGRISSFSADAKTEHLYQFWKAYINKPVILVGPSLGGAVAIDLTLNHPEMVDKLILIDAQGYTEGVGNLSNLPKLIAYAGVALLKSVPLRAYANMLIFNSLSYEALVDYVKVGRLHCLMPGWADALVDFMLSGGYNITCRIPQVTKETMLIWGERDEIVPLDYAERFMKDIEDAKIECIRECGHIPHVEKPEKVAHLIVNLNSY